MIHFPIFTVNLFQIIIYSEYLFAIEYLNENWGNCEIECKNNCIIIIMVTATTEKSITRILQNNPNIPNSCTKQRRNEHKEQILYGSALTSDGKMQLCRHCAKHPEAHSWQCYSARSEFSWIGGWRLWGSWNSITVQHFVFLYPIYS